MINFNFIKANFNFIKVIPVIFIFFISFYGFNCDKTTTYTEYQCGNGIREQGEECDDGNNIAGDGCSEFCLNEPFEICDNNIDDDGNGLIDCLDPLCVGSEQCIGEICGNGYDDDGNGLIDCEDPVCSQNTNCLKDEICNDNIDNNANGLTDCEDSACISHPLCGGCPYNENITSSITEDSTFIYEFTSLQNNEQGYDCFENSSKLWILQFKTETALLFALNVTSVDSTVYTGFFKEEEPDVTCFTDTLLCVFGQTNQNEIIKPLLPAGTYRVIISSVSDATAVLYFGHPEYEICDNGLDDDANGLVDCEDPLCQTVPYCKVEICNNGLDDNANGLTDCEDPDCMIFCAPAETCNNGLDDDLDGKIDCADFDCIGNENCNQNNCIVNAYAGSLSRGSVVSVPFNTMLSSNSIITSCGGMGTDFTISFDLENYANVLINLKQQGLHSIALGSQSSTGELCTDGELFCRKSSGLNMPELLIFKNLPPAKYFIFLDTETLDGSGNGTVDIQVAGSNEELCIGGIDDDNDGNTDCSDSECFSYPSCAGENICHDDIDDDNDGFVDCADPDCMGTSACMTSSCQPDKYLGVLTSSSPLVANIVLENGTSHFEIPCSSSDQSTVLAFNMNEAGKIKIRMIPQGFADPSVALAIPSGNQTDCNQSIYMCSASPSPGISVITQTNDILPAGDYYLIVNPYIQGETGEVQIIVYKE